MYILTLSTLQLFRMNHSCSPNVVWSFKEKSPLTKEVRALKMIAKDEELVANYIDSFEVCFLIF